MIKLTTAILLLTFSGILNAATAFRENVPTLAIIGVIGRGNILPVGEEMLALADKGTKEVQLIINSPGGSVTTGFMFLSLMDAARQKGLKVTCFVPQVAASMAFQILLHCDSRYSLSNAFLLWHRARVMLPEGQALTGPEATKLGRDLELTDSGILRDILKVMSPGMSEKELTYHFEVETLHTGSNLHIMSPTFITAQSVIPGLLAATRKATAIVRMNSLFGMLSINDFGSSEIVYISQQLAD